MRAIGEIKLSRESVKTMQPGRAFQQLFSFWPHGGRMSPAAERIGAPKRRSRTPNATNFSQAKKALPPAWSTHARDTETQRRELRGRECCGICNSGVPELKIPQRFLGAIPGERGEVLTTPPSRRIPSRNRGVYFLHMYSCGKINATFEFSVSQCL